MKKNILAIAVAAMGVFAATAAHADTTASFAVTANVQAACAISAQPLAFGNYDRANGTTGSTSLTVDCTKDSAAIVSLDLGTNGSGFRQLSNGTDKLNYELYSDSGRTMVWDNQGVEYNGVGNPETLTVYGAISAGQNVSAGAYSDVVTASVVFAPQLPN